MYDIIIRNGTIVDGSGMPRFRGDVGIAGGKIAAIGRLHENARETIDADGHIVSPGIVDAHTHMDAQVFWDPIGTCSCWHGITSVVMGNCGFSLAPCAEKDKLLVMRNLERAEDIAPEATEAGIKWSWETFPQYLDAVERTPKGGPTGTRKPGRDQQVLAPGRLCHGFFKLWEGAMEMNVLKVGIPVRVDGLHVEFEAGRARLRFDQDGLHVPHRNHAAEREVGPGRVCPKAASRRASVGSVREVRGIESAADAGKNAEVGQSRSRRKELTES